MSSEGAARGLLFVVSAPSGTGKTTVVNRLVERMTRLERSRSYTSRPMRAGERDGVDYNFISRPAFQAMVAHGDFLEWAEVFGHCYGTSHRDTEARLATGADLVLVIDVQGARQVRQRAPHSIGVFVLPPSREALSRRLLGRAGTNDPEVSRRLATASSEVAAVREYDYVVVNDELEACVGQMAAIVSAERARVARQRGLVERVVGTFR